MCSTKTQPGRNASFSISSKPQSSVYILGIDKRLTYLATGNDLDPKNFSTAYSANELDVHVIEEDFSNMVECTSQEIEMFQKYMEELSFRIGGQSSGGSGFHCPDNMMISENLDEEGTEDYTEMSALEARENFPETWLFETIEMGNEEIVDFQRKVPDSITSWIISAFSMNPKYGFALAERKELIVSRQFFASLNLPYSVRMGEIIDIDVIIFNFISKETMDVTVTLKVSNKLEIISKKSSGDSCKFEALTSKELKKEVVASTGRGTKVTFSVRSSEAGSFAMTIYADGKARKNKKFYADAVEKFLQVEPAGVRIFTNDQAIISKERKDNFTYVNTRTDGDEGESKCKSKTIELYSDTISKSLQHSERYK